ncbi:MAG: dipicolinate synthase subunit B [Clostridiales bacterium]|nr:dipicolinate synthase subunit B [Clostridiales bacterium]
MKVGFAFTGSFCTLQKGIDAMKDIACCGYDVLPIMSETAYGTDTRFGRAADFRAQIEEAAGKDIIHTIEGAEPIGPKKLLDILIIAPCTGNTLAKLATGITDTAVTMAAKSHLRNSRAVIIGVSTNDALGAAAKNIGLLLNSKNYYFVPFGQDDCQNKPKSMVCDFSLIKKTLQDIEAGRDILKKIF